MFDLKSHVGGKSHINLRPAISEQELNDKCDKAKSIILQLGITPGLLLLVNEGSGWKYCVHQRSFSS